MDYEKILKRIVQIINTTENSDIGFTNICTYIGENCPELQKSEDERIRKELIDYINRLTVTPNNIDRYNAWIAWLEKQGETNETIDRDEFAQGVLRGAAINLITWIDYNAAEGNMCLSNVQCKEIENALVRGDWNKIYAYMKKKLERQDEQKPAAWSEVDKNFMYDTLSNLTELKDRYGEGYGNVGKCIDWLESLKDRIQPQSQPAWSEEDECYMGECISAIATKDGWSFEEKRKTKHWLEQIKQRMEEQQ